MSNTRVQLNKGIVILFAVLLVSIVLAISLSLFNITFKQLVLSSVVRESSVAFYAADSGLSCALSSDVPTQDWVDVNDDGLNDRSNLSSPFGYFYRSENEFGPFLFKAPDPNVTVTCAGLSSTPSYADATRISSFTIFYNGADGKESCALVAVDKSNAESSFDTSTDFRADGYNIAGRASAECPLMTDRTVERTRFLHTIN